MSTPPPLPPTADPATGDRLRLLGILHLVLGIPLFGFYSVPILYRLFGSGADEAGPATRNHASPEAAVMQVFVDLGIGVALMLCTLAVAIMAAGWCLLRRRYRRFCIGVAAVECIAVPIGTVLGVWSLVVLLRAKTRAVFAAR